MKDLLDSLITWYDTIDSLSAQDLRQQIKQAGEDDVWDLDWKLCHEALILAGKPIWGKG